MKHTRPTLSVAADPRPCMNRDPELWFSEFREDVARAKAGCAACPVRAECFAGAVERREPLGVWGGVRFDNGKPLDRTPAKARHSRDAERDRQRRRAEQEAARAAAEEQKREARRRAAEPDPVAVDRAVEAIGARLPTGPMGYRERRAVVARVYPRYGLSARQLAELLGVSERTVNRMCGPTARIRPAVAAA